MTKQCPVCGDYAEHVRMERPGDPAAHPEANPGPQASIEVDELCTAEPDDQWDRICHKAAVERSATGGMMSPVLEVYYHFFENEEEENEQ